MFSYSKARLKERLLRIKEGICLLFCFPVFTRIVYMLLIQLIHFSLQRETPLLRNHNARIRKTGNMAEAKQIKTVADQIPFHTFCMLLQKISDTQGKEKKKAIFAKFLDHWRQTHKNTNGDTAINVGLLILYYKLDYVLLNNFIQSFNGFYYNLIILGPTYV